MLCALTLLFLLFVTLTQVPFWMALHYGPAYGLLPALVGIALWARLVPPMPGLIQGAICLGGLFSLTLEFGILVVLSVWAGPPELPGGQLITSNSELMPRLSKVATIPKMRRPALPRGRDSLWASRPKVSRQQSP